MGWIFSRKLPRIINVGFTERAIRIFPHGRREAISKTLRVEANVGYVLQKNDSLGVTGLSCFLKKQCLQAFFKSYIREPNCTFTLDSQLHGVSCSLNDQRRSPTTILRRFIKTRFYIAISHCLRVWKEKQDGYLLGENLVSYTRKMTNSCLIM